MLTIAGGYPYGGAIFHDHSDRPLLYLRLDPPATRGDPGAAARASHALFLFHIIGPRGRQFRRDPGTERLIARSLCCKATHRRVASPLDNLAQIGVNDAQRPPGINNMGGLIMAENQPGSESSPEQGTQGGEPTERIPIMQRILDNPFLLLFLGITVPTVFYIIWGVMEIVQIPIAK